MGDKKLTWTERQAMAKKQQAEDEEKSRSASTAGKCPLRAGAREHGR